MKKTAEVVAAEKILSAKATELDEARALVRRLEAEHAAALYDVRLTQAAADASLPQCRVVRFRWRSSNEDEVFRAVILRKTPAGTLVVRPVGEPAGREHRFKPNRFNGIYTEAVKHSFGYDRRELRDVPPEYAFEDQR